MNLFEKEWKIRNNILSNKIFKPLWFRLEIYKYLFF